MADLVPTETIRAVYVFPGDRDDGYYLDAARALAAHTDCTRRNVGALVVSPVVAGGVIVGRGRNTSPPGQPGCADGGCPRGRLSYTDLPPHAPFTAGTPGECIAVCAEAAAVADAGYPAPGDRLPATVGATLYTTYRPCDDCARLIAAAGIARVVIAPEGDL